MSSLPPYSTYRTNNKQQVLYPQQLSHGNVLTFTPPGFNQTLNVKFPDCRLAVCEKCKKNYKTRDMCRVRNAHTTEPWTTAYICFTLDDNCTDENGKYVEKPLTVRMIQWQPYCVRTPFDPKTPVCSACKKTNRTRSFCRERHKHRQLPWCTVYVLLSPADMIDPSTRVAPESTPVEETQSEIKSENLKTAENSQQEGGETAKSDTQATSPENGADSKEGEGDVEEQASAQTTVKTGPAIISEKSSEGDDINDIAESRTFLAMVSCKASSVHWLELAEFDTQDQMNVGGVSDGMMVRGAHGMPPHPVHIDPSGHYPYAAHGFPGYHPQQHQYNLKSHQQYFFHMHQRQHQQYAAQQAAWQAQYNQQPQMQMSGHPHHPPPPGHGVPPGAPPPPLPPPSQGTTPASPGSVTAGEAAAKASQNHAPPPPPSGQPEQPSPGAMPHHPVHWQNHMMYHQQMYQNQMAQFQQAGGVIPTQMQQQHQHPSQQPSPAAPPPPGSSSTPAPPPEQHVQNNDQYHPPPTSDRSRDGQAGEDDMEPAPVHAMETPPEGESSAKRPRLI